MPEIQEITDPAKRVTDPILLKELAKQDIDPNYVEFWHDYAPRSKGKEYSPYAKFYRDLKSGKKMMVASGLPMVKVEGHKIEPGWLYAKGRYYSKANLFSAIIKGKQVKLICLSDQPTGAKKDEQVTYRPQLFLDGSEILDDEQPTLLPSDPVNGHYKENTLEWEYGTVCKRRIRIIEGRFRERWLFGANPCNSVRIKHNFAGSLKLKLGRAVDAEGNPLQVSIIGDEEIVEASEFDKAVYPVEIGASATFYPDAHEETSSVDGGVLHVERHLSFAAIRAAAGTTGYDEDESRVYPQIHSDTETDWYVIARTIYLFDTSGLPDGATITATTLSLYGVGKVDQLSIAPDINIYSSNPASNIALEAGDYEAGVDKFGSVAFCDTPITYANWKTTDPYWNDFVFNATGLAAISKTGVSKFGARNANYDVSGTIPAYSSWKYSYFRAYFSEKGTGYKPKLTVTYPPYAVPDGDLIGIAIIRRR